MRRVTTLLVVSAHWPSSSTTVARPFVGLARVITLGSLLMAIQFGQRATEVEMSLGLLFAVTVIVLAILD